MAETIERAVEINAENDRLRGREKEVEEENARHLKEREQHEKERFPFFSLHLTLNGGDSYTKHLKKSDMVTQLW